MNSFTPSAFVAACFCTVLLFSASVAAIAQPEKADALIRDNKFEDAIVLANQTLANNPSNDTWLVKRGAARLGLDLYADSMEDLDRAVELNPKNAEAYAFRAKLMQALEKGEDCLRDISTAIDIDPKPEYLFYRGTLLMLVPELSGEAAKDFTAAMNKGAQNAQIYNSRAAAYFSDGKIADAEKDCNKAIELDSKWSEPYILRSQLKLANFDLDGSCADTRKAYELQNQPYNDTLFFYCSKRDYTTYVLLGMEYEKKSLFEPATRAYTKALELRPDTVGLYLSRGAMFQNLQQYDRAEADYATAERKGLKSSLLNYNWAVLKMQKKDFVKALTYFDKVLAAEPKSASVWAQHGLCNKQLSKLDDAYNDFNKAIELDSTAGVAFAQRAYCLIAKKKIAEAKADAEQAILLQPDYGFGYLMRGQAKYFLKETDACDDFYRAVLLKTPDSESAMKEFCKDYQPHTPDPEGTPTMQMPQGKQ